MKSVIQPRFVCGSSAPIEIKNALRRAVNELVATVRRSNGVSPMTMCSGTMETKPTSAAPALVKKVIGEFYRNHVINLITQEPEIAYFNRSGLRSRRFFNKWHVFVAIA
jgi:hypothetical protein